MSSSPFIVEWIERIARGGSGERRALDVAMGRGRYAVMLARSGFRTFGVDITADVVQDAMKEHAVAGDYHRRIAVARKPVFSIGTLAMAVTMTAAILGASVDTGVLPPMIHAMIAYGAIACNLAAAKVEITALMESSRIVDEVNRQL